MCTMQKRLASWLSWARTILCSFCMSWKFDSNWWSVGLRISSTSGLKFNKWCKLLYPHWKHESNDFWQNPCSMWFRNYPDPSCDLRQEQNLFSLVTGIPCCNTRKYGMRARVRTRALSVGIMVKNSRQPHTRAQTILLHIWPHRIILSTCMPSNSVPQRQVSFAFESRRFNLRTK